MIPTKEHLETAIKAAQDALDRWNAGGMNAFQVLIDVRNAKFALEQAEHNLQAHTGD